MVAKGSSNRDIKYDCTECGRDVGKDNLVARIVSFKEVGEGGRQIRSRTTGWLCIIPADDGGPSCRDLDPAWNQPKRVGTPGMADTRLANIELEEPPTEVPA